MNPELQTHQAWLKRMRLAARRGNQETDLLLNGFLDRLTTHTAFAHAELFEQLVQQDDQTLFEWLLRPQHAPDGFRELIEQIRKIYLNSTP